MENTCSIILAAGEGKRMKSNKPKVLSEVLFKPMLGWIIDSLNELGINDTCVITGFKSEMVENYLKSLNADFETILQKERKGTAHAVMQAGEFLNNRKGRSVLILGGDSPFIDSETIKNAYELHIANGNSATIISSVIDNSFGYGRIVRDSNEGNVQEIVEEKDANGNIKKIKEVNSGAYWFRIDELLKVLYNISNDTAQAEYYLTDAIRLLINNGLKVGAYQAKSQDVVLGANDCVQLQNLNNIARKKIIEKVISEGVNIPIADGIIIGKDVKIGKGTKLLPGTIIHGDTEIGEDCIIGPNSQIYSCNIENKAVINSSYCEGVTIKSSQKVGPFEIRNLYNWS